MGGNSKREKLRQESIFGAVSVILHKKKMYTIALSAASKTELALWCFRSHPDGDAGSQTQSFSPPQCQEPCKRESLSPWLFHEQSLTKLKHIISYQGFKSMQDTMCSWNEWEKKIGKKRLWGKKVGRGREKTVSLGFCR